MKKNGSGHSAAVYPAAYTPRHGAGIGSVLRFLRERCDICQIENVSTLS